MGRYLIYISFMFMPIVTLANTTVVDTISEPDPCILISGSSLLNHEYSSVLYKAGITVYGHYFSGIFLFKKMPADSSYRIVMLSEFGLSYFDFIFKNNEFTVESVQDFLNKPLLIKLLQNDMRFWLTPIENPEKIKSISKNKDFDAVYKFKYKSDNYCYFYDQNNKLRQILKKEGLFGKAKISIDGYTNDLPNKVEVIHKRGKFIINLTLLKTEY